MEGMLTKKSTIDGYTKKVLKNWLTWNEAYDCHTLQIKDLHRGSTSTSCAHEPTIPLSPARRHWPAYTLTDPAIVDEYVQKVHACWLAWSQGWGSPRERVNTLHKIISEIHTKCGVCPSLLQSYCLSAKYDPATGISSFSNGMFRSSEWRMEINEHLVTERLLGIDDFLSIIEAVYHEGRHAEQFWLIIVDALYAWRHEVAPGEYAVFDTDIEELHQKTNIPYRILHEAAKKACYRPEVPIDCSPEHDKLVSMIKSWWDHYFGRQVPKAAEIYANMSSCEQAYHKYVSHLPAEADAFSIQGLVRERLAAITRFADEVKVLNELDPIIGHCSCSL